MAERDADIDPLIIYHCPKHGQRWLKWNRICTKCMPPLIPNLKMDVLDLRDPKIKDDFLAALRKYGVPINGHAV